MTSCLGGGGGGGGRTYRLDLDMVKSSSSSTRSSSSSSSSPSSALSDSSHLPLLAISIKKPRAPRKRPNQTYNEAAALLSTAYPTVFLPSPKTLSKQPRPLCSSSSSSSSSSFPPDPSADLLPALPVLGDAAFLILRPSPVEPKAAVANNEFAEQPSLSSPTSAVTAEFRDGSCSSPALSPAVSNEFREELPPGSPAFSDGGDFDAESILDEEAEQGIDAIMGNLSMSAPSTNGNENENGNTVPGCGVNPYVRSLVGFGLGGKFELGLGFTYGRSIHRALRQRDGGHRWSSPTVPVKDICSKFKAPTASSPSVVPAEAKKSKKKSKKVEKDAPADTHSPASAAAPPAATAAAEQAEAGSKRVALGLKLNHDEVLKAWSDRGSMFSSDGPDSPNSSAEALAKLADIDLVPESGAREASVMRYKEKRRSRLFAKKIRYQVRKANADCRPRMKASGRFVRRPSLLQQAIEEGS